MTLRSIELQVAIPRTSEVGQIQNQLAQKPAYDQNQLAQQSAKKADEQLKKATKLIRRSSCKFEMRSKSKAAAGMIRSGKEGRTSRPNLVKPFPFIHTRDVTSI